VVFLTPTTTRGSLFIICQDVEDNHFKMGVDDWDIIGQCTASLMTVTAVVKQAEGDKYPTSSLVLPFMNSCMRSLSEDDPIKQTWLGTANVRREFPVSSAHDCVQSVDFHDESMFSCLRLDVVTTHSVV
jgi:hypothetical protein